MRQTHIYEFNLNISLTKQSIGLRLVLGLLHDAEVHSLYHAVYVLFSILDNDIWSR